jgi:hypothetical protein
LFDSIFIVKTSQPAAVADQSRIWIAVPKNTDGTSIALLTIDSFGKVVVALPGTKIAN